MLLDMSTAHLNTEALQQLWPLCLTEGQLFFFLKKNKPAGHLKVFSALPIAERHHSLQPVLSSVVTFPNQCHSVDFHLS